MSEQTQVGKPQWGDGSAFDVLDESWPDQAVDKGAGVLGDRTNVTVGQKDSSHAFKPITIRRASEATKNEDVDPEEPIAGPSNAPQLPIRYAKDDIVNARPRRRRSSSAATDSELLQAGPSSPSHRLPSHKFSRTFDGISKPSSTTPEQDQAQYTTSETPTEAHVPIATFDRTASSSSSHSEQKRTASPFGDEGIGDESGVRSENAIAGAIQPSVIDGEDFGSALEDVSSSQAALTAEEGTFIEYSNIDSPPPFMKQAWQKRDKGKLRKDIFGPSPLQALFLPPSPTPEARVDEAELEAKVVSQRESQKSAEDTSNLFEDKQDENSTDKVDVSPEDQEESMLIEDSEASSDQADEDASGSIADTSSNDLPQDDSRAEVESNASNSAQSQDEMVDASVMEASEDTVESIALAEVTEEQRTAEEELNDAQSQPKELIEPEFESVETAKEDESLLESVPEHQPTTEVPATTFTFASPLLLRTKRPPPTPSSVHAPLRLLQLRGRDPEVEQLLNTPRSAARSREVKRLVWKLVGDSSDVLRSKKRARVDDASLDEVEPARDEQDQLMQANADDRPSIETKNGSRFLDRLRQLRASSEGSNRTASSLIAQRKGAKAPTPERARHGADTLKPSKPGDNDQLTNESPSKLLRRWSAANLANERTRNEESTEKADDADVTLSPLIPRVSVEPPPATSPIKDLFVDGRIASVNRPADHPGMLQIAGDAIPLQDMEVLSNGKMTFDTQSKRWIRAQQLKDRADSSMPSLDDSLDPFRDIETIVSPVSNHITGKGAGASKSVSPPFMVDQSSSRLVPPALWQSKAVSELLTPAKNAQSKAIGSTPRSILKTAERGIKGARWPMSDTTPILARQASRKISFADGINPRSVASQRKERLAVLLNQLGALALASDEEELEGVSALPGSPAADSKASINWPSPDHASTLLAPTTPDSLLQSHTSNKKSIQLGQRSPWGLSQLRSVSRREGDLGNASFMTNASFNIAHDRILELLTDIAPWTTRWHDMRKIDLRGRRVESLVRIEEFLPQLEEALLDDNEITYLTGLPNTLRRLFIARNRLPSTAAFGHLSDLELLDVSGNRVDLKALRSLTNLRHLRANSNRIVSLDGLQHLSKLETLHLRDNLIERFEVAQGQWSHLQDVVLSRNRIVHVDGLHHLTQLQCLNLDHNSLLTLQFEQTMAHLKQLRVSSNAELHTLDVGQAVNLRTLYADECALHEVRNIGLLHKLDNLSLRQQHGKRSLHWPAQDIRDVKRLFLSGNAFRVLELSNVRRPSRISPFATMAPLASNSVTQFFNLIYLELSGCQLTALPDDLAEMTPNVRHLNADYNLLDRLPVLTKLRRLKRLSVVGCRIDSSRTLVKSIAGCEELVYFDVRMNPCTLGLYPPIVMATTKRGKRDVNRAFLPPIPHPLFAGVRSDETAKTTAKQAKLADESQDDDMLQGMGSVAEKSYFHKRRPPPLLADSVGTRDGLDDDDDRSALSRSKRDEVRQADEHVDLGALFAASDQRFAPTLPTKFRLQRTLHRGCLAMACASLTWLDGLLIDEDEVLQAERHLKTHPPKDQAHLEEVDLDASSSEDIISSSDDL